MLKMIPVTSNYHIQPEWIHLVFFYENVITLTKEEFT